MRAAPARFALIPVLLLNACTVHHHYPAVPPLTPVAVEEDVSECAPLLPAPEAFAGGRREQSRRHFHPQSEAFNESGLAERVIGEPRVISHAELTKFENEGTVLVGLATAGLGARNFEIWRSSVPPGGATPVHVHDTEEIFLVLRGKGKLLVGDQALEFEAPATVIAPAAVPHQIINTGDVPTDQIVVVGVGSEIKNDQGTVMSLPWRN